MSLERVRGRLPRAPLPEFCAAALVTGALAVFFTVALPPHGDASAHFYRTFLVRRGDFLWDNYWYGGEYPLASYSLLYYLPAALLGNTVVAVAAAVAGSVVFTALALDAWARTRAGRLGSIPCSRSSRSSRPSIRSRSPCRCSWPRSAACAAGGHVSARCSRR
jgi:hypothetical protein